MPFLFWRKKAPADTPQSAIQNFRKIEEMLNKKVAHLERKIQDKLALAKQYGMKNKKAALRALNNKKKLEMELTKIDGTLTTIEFQREALENATTNTEVLKAMQDGAKVLKKTQCETNIDDVTAVLDEIHEQQEIAQEISDVISTPVGMGHENDEDELMKELEELEQEKVDEKLLEIDKTSVPQLPSAPTTAPTAKKSEQAKEEDEMRQLEAWAT